MTSGRKPPAPLPSKQQILDFVRDSKTPVGRREIARAFNIKGGDRTFLRGILKELKLEGLLEDGRGR